MESIDPGPAVTGVIVPTPHVLRMAVVAYLARFKGQSRIHTESDLRGYLTWCQTRGLDPLAATRPHIELYLRWLQEVRRFKPSTVSRRMSVVTGFYRTCVIDDVLPHSPADYVRRPNVPAESPTLGLTHLQFEALLTAARESSNRFDFALVTMLGLLGLRIFEATGSDIGDLGEEHGHRVLRVHGKGDKIALVPLPPAVGRAIERAIDDRTTGSILLTSEAHEWTATAPPDDCTASPNRPESGSPGCIPTCCDTPSSPPCSTPEWTSATSRSQPDTPTQEPPCATTARARTWTDTPTTSSPHTWQQARNGWAEIRALGSARDRPSASTVQT
jgi:hypothetical protein